MDLLLAILTWLGVFAPGTQITTTEYDQALQSNAIAIQALVSDTLLNQQAVTAYGDGTRLIVIDPNSR
jgi:hypothetical protein